MSFINSNLFNTEVDIDMRTGMHDILYGNARQKPQGRFAVLQLLKRDENGNPEQSNYSYKNTGEGQHKNRGPLTTRTGYYCTEKLVRCYYRPTRLRLDETTLKMGPQASDKEVIFLSYTDPVKEHDVIVLINIDENGNPVNPVSPEKELIVVKVYPYCSTDGRVEYYAALVEDQK